MIPAIRIIRNTIPIPTYFHTFRQFHRSLVCPYNITKPMTNAARNMPVPVLISPWPQLKRSLTPDLAGALALFAGLFNRKKPRLLPCFAKTVTRLAFYYRLFWVGWRVVICMDFAVHIFFWDIRLWFECDTHSLNHTKNMVDWTFKEFFFLFKTKTW